MTRTSHLLLMSAVTLTMAATAGCGTGLLDQNQGGDTPCGDYLEMTADDQRDVILTYLDEQGHRTLPVSRSP